MKKYLLCLPLLLFFHIGNSQVRNSLGDFQDGASLFIKSFSRHGACMNFGNGFVVKVNDGFFFITNRHNIDSIDYYTRLNHCPRQYDSVQIRGIRNLKYSDKVGVIRTGDQHIIIGNKYKGIETDIVAIPLGSKISEEFVVLEIPEKSKVTKGQEVFTVTLLPLGDSFVSMSFFANITSDPRSDLETEYNMVLPVVSLDRPSVKGMSGSPVFACQGNDKKPVFVGILSANSNENAIFWRSEIVFDLIREISQHPPQ